VVFAVEVEEFREDWTENVEDTLVADDCRRRKGLHEDGKLRLGRR
jgi:hypothetical protein